MLCNLDSRYVASGMVLPSIMMTSFCFEELGFAVAAACSSTAVILTPSLLRPLVQVLRRESKLSRLESAKAFKSVLVDLICCCKLFSIEKGRLGFRGFWKNLERKKLWRFFLFQNFHGATCQPRYGYLDYGQSNAAQLKLGYASQLEHNVAGALALVTLKLCVHS